MAALLSKSYIELKNIYTIVQANIQMFYFSINVEPLIRIKHDTW